MDRIYGVTGFTMTEQQEGAKPVECIIISARAAILALKKSYKLQWYCRILKFEAIYHIGYGYVAVGFSPVTGKMIVVKDDELRKHVNIIET